ncbi:MAG: glycosyltransferase [Aminivibrio sp.]|uniref:glycosyltransferase family 2 protein n=1 Tax=Aminivibrio sp. TaxID=1872489 RepID=UPI002B1F2D71|nr:glycosyltransferase [Aminivibrio sp.]MEA4951923.1 glycosyltransferase [Aminivibrio sp.]
MISVIIATKNRDEALRNISLPSLLRQDTSDFEVILWDASDSEKSRRVAEQYVPLFEEKRVPLRYFRAPRVGSASQRNDAVKSARGGIVFFIDDDCEVSSDGLSALEKCFEEYPECMGAGLMVFDKDAPSEKKLSFGESLKKKLYAALGYVKRRKVHPSGSNGGLKAPPGPAEWLSGGSMAFRRDVFSSMAFNEKLQIFGGYAMGEDVEFSHRVFLRFGRPLEVPARGKVIHHEAPQGRSGIDEKRIAMFFYNRYIIMRLSSQRAPLWGRIAYGWNMVRRFFFMGFRCGFSPVFRGAVLAWRQIQLDKKTEKSKRSCLNDQD